MLPLAISSSTEEERRNYVRETYRCPSDCDSCGLCAFFHGKDPEVAYADYIEGKREFLDVTMDLR